MSVLFVLDLQKRSAAPLQKINLKGRVVYFGVKAADFSNKLWRCCNTLTILKESLTAERIAWFATQRIQRIGGLP